MVLVEGVFDGFDIDGFDREGSFDVFILFPVLDLLLDSINLGFRKYKILVVAKYFDEATFSQIPKD